ncbi:6-phosphofructokinase [Bradyrhizobium barranii]
MAKRRIGILTGGGDVAGLNAVIKSVTYRGSEDDIEVVGLRRGWEALTHLNLEDPTSRSHYVIPLNRENTRTIDRRGGTVLHSSRVNPSKIQKLPDHLVGNDVPVSLSTNGGIATKTWDLTSRVLANHFGTWHRTPDRHRWRRHAQLCGQAQRTRRQDHRHPEDDG